VTPHHFTLTDEACRDYDTRAKMNPPLRTAEDVAALMEGLADGAVDAIATDHAPHGETEKQTDFESAPFGITGLETALGLALERLYHTGKISLPRLVELFSTNPARILGVEGGQLKVGAPADVTIFDLERGGPTAPLTAPPRAATHPSTAAPSAEPPSPRLSTAPSPSASRKQKRQALRQAQGKQECLPH
jgi:hypothetical protein